MAKLTLSDFASLGNETSAVATLNANNTLIETALENTLSRDGTTPNTMSANLDMNSNRILNLAAPSNSNEPVRLADLDAYIEQLDGTSTLLPAAVTGDVDKIPRVASAGLLGYSGIGIDSSDNLRPELTDGGALGTSSLMWSDLFLASGGVINWNAGNYTITHTAGTLTFNGNIVNAGDLTVGDDIFLSSGAVLNFDTGNVTVTHSAGVLALVGSLTVSNDITVTDDLTVGDDLLLGSGSIINFDGGDVTVTHSANTLTIAGGNVVTNGSSLATGAIGYTTGAGSTVTQATSKSTGVTINALSGQITMNNASLAAGAEVAFTVTNSTVAATDVVVLSIASGATAAAYAYAIGAVGAGSFSVTLGNLTAGALGEAVVLNFVVIKGVTS